MDTILGKMNFDIGWKCKGEIELFGRSWPIVFKAKAYRQEDGITSAQKKAFENFEKNGAILLHEVEELLPPQEQSRYIPKILLFNRDGEVALLLDDYKNLDDGVRRY